MNYYEKVKSAPICWFGCWGSCFYFIVMNYKSISRHKFVSEKIVYLYLSKESCFICFVFTTNKMSSFFNFLLLLKDKSLILF